MRLIARFRRWLDGSQETVYRRITPFEARLMDGGFRYRAARPYIYGVVGRRDDRWRV